MRKVKLHIEQFHFMGGLHLLGCDSAVGLEEVVIRAKILLLYGEIVMFLQGCMVGGINRVNDLH